MTEHLPKRISLADLMEHSNVTVEHIWSMFNSDKVHFYRGETLLTFGKKTTFIKPPTAQLMLPFLEAALIHTNIIVAEEAQRQFEAGFLLPDFDCAHDRKNTYVICLDVIKWFSEQSKIFTIKPECRHLWDNNPSQEITPKQTHPLQSNKETALAIAKHELEKEKENSDKWFMLKVGILSLDGKGLENIAKDYGYGKNWAIPRRKNFIKYMKDTHKIDTAPFMPKVKRDT